MPHRPVQQQLHAIGAAPACSEHVDTLYILLHWVHGPFPFPPFLTVADMWVLPSLLSSTALRSLGAGSSVKLCHTNVIHHGFHGQHRLCPTEWSHPVGQGQKQTEGETRARRSPEPLAAAAAALMAKVVVRQEPRVHKLTPCSPWVTSSGVNDNYCDLSKQLLFIFLFESSFTIQMHLPLRTIEDGLCQNWLETLQFC